MQMGNTAGKMLSSPAMARTGAGHRHPATAAHSAAATSSEQQQQQQAAITALQGAGGLHVHKNDVHAWGGPLHTCTCAKLIITYQHMVSLVKLAGRASTSVRWRRALVGVPGTNSVGSALLNCERGRESTSHHDQPCSTQSAYYCFSVIESQ